MSYDFDTLAEPPARLKSSANLLSRTHILHKSAINLHSLYTASLTHSPSHVSPDSSDDIHM